MKTNEPLAVQRIYNKNKTNNKPKQNRLTGGPSVCALMKSKGKSAKCVN